MDSSRVYASRTGRRVCLASSAKKISTVMSSLPPNPPPSIVPWMWILFWGTPTALAIERKCSTTCVQTRMLITSRSSTQATPASGSM